MAHADEPDALLPKSSRLRWEISIALLLKLVLLVGLWLLLFRWLERPAGKPDIAARFALPAVSIDSSAQSIKEANHVR